MRAANGGLAEGLHPIRAGRPRPRETQATTARQRRAGLSFVCPGPRPSTSTVARLTPSTLGATQPRHRPYGHGQLPTTTPACALTSTAPVTVGMP